MKKLKIGAALILMTVASSCTTVTVKHEVAPIYVNVDVNIRIQKELESIFDFEKKRSSEDSSTASDSKGDSK